MASDQPSQPDTTFILEKYRILQKLAFNEDRLFGERSTFFVLAGTLLVTAFSAMGEHERSLRLLICVAGSLLVILWLYVNSQAIIALRFWRTRIHLLEERHLGGEKWGIHVARARYYRGADKFPMPAEPDIDGPLDETLFKRFGTLFFPNKTLHFGMPLIFLGLWLALAIAIIVRT